MTTLTDFLLARIAEDETVAREAIEDDGGQTGGMEDSFDLLTGREQWFGADVLPRYADPLARLIVHAAVPARTLAECEAKRAVIAAAHEAGASGTCEIGWNEGQACSVYDTFLAAMAAVYADHPDYREEWRP